MVELTDTVLIVTEAMRWPAVGPTVVSASHGTSRERRWAGDRAAR
jgi:hypothetical protein